jgi:hypothetical protein
MRPIPQRLTARVRSLAPRRTDPGAAFEGLARRRPGTALGLALGVLVVGYALLLAFPALALALTLHLIGELADPVPSLPYMAGVGAALAGAGAAGWMSFALLRLRPHGPQGVAVDRRSPLRAQVEALRALCGAPRIHRLQLVPEHMVRLVRTPRHALPLAFENTLQIGLPVLLSGSPAYLRVLLLRALLELRSGLAHPAGWALMLCGSWSALGARLAGDRDPARYPLRLFFPIYGRLAERLSGPALRQAALRADHGTLELVNDEAVRDAITRFELVDRVLERVFWPEFLALAKRHRLPPSGPFGLMADTLSRELTGRRLEAHLQRLALDPGTAQRPALEERLQAIGHRRPEPPPPFDPAETEEALGGEVAALTRDFDRAWLVHNTEGWRRRHARNRARLREGLRLQKLAKARRLGAKESWDYVRLVRERIKDPEKALRLYKQALKSRPENPRTLLFVGRMLLAAGDEAGVRALRRAAALDPALGPDVSRMIPRARAQDAAGRAGGGPATFPAPLPPDSRAPALGT